MLVHEQLFSIQIPTEHEVKTKKSKERKSDQSIESIQASRFERRVLSFPYTIPDARYTRSILCQEPIGSFVE